MIATFNNNQEEIKKDKNILLERGIVGLQTWNEKKSLIQSYAVEIAKQHNHLVLSWATGCGKSLAALRIIKERVDNGDTTKWYIVCKETNHITNWISDIAKHKLGYLMNYIEIFCYASLHKYKNTKANLILDESHAVSDLRQEILKTIEFSEIVSLSATLNDDRKRQLNEISKIREFTINIDDAINYGLLPPPKIYIVHSKPNTANNNCIYIKKKGTQDKKTQKFEIDHKDYYNFLVNNKETPSYLLEIKCTEQQYYDLLTNDMAYYKKIYASTKAIWAKNKWLQLGSERKVLISNMKSKILNDLVHINLSSCTRFIAFTGSIQQCAQYEHAAIHSKIPKKKREEKISSFNKGDRTFLAAVDMLREGMNLENIEAGIITQLDSEELSFVQMMGRVFRSENPILFVIVMDNTQDVTYLKKCIGGLDNRFLTYVEYNEENIKALEKLLWENMKENLEKSTEQRKNLYPTFLM